MNVTCFVLCKQETLPSARRICPLFSASHWLQLQHLLFAVFTVLRAWTWWTARRSSRERRRLCWSSGGQCSARGPSCQSSGKRRQNGRMRRGRSSMRTEAWYCSNVCFFLHGFVTLSVRPSVSDKNINPYRCVYTTVLWTGRHLMHEPITVTNHSDTNYLTENLKRKWPLISKFLIPFFKANLFNYAQTWNMLKLTTVSRIIRTCVRRNSYSSCRNMPVGRE